MATEEMVTRPTLIGTPGHLHVALQWRGDYGTDGPVGRTWGDLELWVRDTLVWGSFDDATGRPTGIRWSWIDLLEFLAIAWPYLIEEESYPLPFDTGDEAPKHPGELLGRAKLRWRSRPEDLVHREDSLVRDFLSVHDLGESLQGAFPPRLTLLRQGKLMLAATAAQQWTLNFDQTRATLQDLGNVIAARLQDLADDRALLAQQRWKDRDGLPPDQRIEIATGLDRQYLDACWPFPLDSPPANDDLYEVKAAARMVGSHLPPAAVRAILKEIVDIPAGSPIDLGPIRDEVNALLREHANDEPWMQGYELARTLRRLTNQGHGCVDPERLLRNWGVVIRDIAIEAGRLDAVAAWGSRHPPTILINTLGPRSQYPTGRRSTCAHEICHLLADTEGALPAAEVLGGRVPRPVEQRANAFAAELLLPLSEVRNHLQQAIVYVYDPAERKRVVYESIRRLAEQYQVSHEMTAWQLKNSGLLDESEEFALQPYLRSINTPL